MQIADAGIRRTDLAEYLKDCVFCNQFGRFTNKPPVQAIVYEAPNHRWQIDLKSYENYPYEGYKYVRNLS
jgi:hypothetical protein